MRAFVQCTRVGVIPAVSVCNPLQRHQLLYVHRRMHAPTQISYPATIAVVGARLCATFDKGETTHS